MSEEAMRAIEQLAPLLGVDVVAALADEAEERRIREALGRMSEPDFEVRMVSPSSIGGAEFSGRGVDGFWEVWKEWTSPFETFRIVLDRRVEAENDVVIDVVRIMGRTKTGGVEVEHAGAAVWTLPGGKLAKVIFHLDPDDALRAAGIDPGGPSS